MPFYNKPSGITLNTHKISLWNIANTPRQIHGTEPAKGQAMPALGGSYKLTALSRLMPLMPNYGLYIHQIMNITTASYLMHSLMIWIFLQLNNTNRTLQTLWQHSNPTSTFGMTFYRPVEEC